MDTNIICGDAEIQNFLQSKIEAGGIAGAVANEVLRDQYIAVHEWFDGLSKHGCISGWVNSMVWYTDTHRFFDKHYDEIEELRKDWEDQIGQQLEIKGDLKNFLAWLAFENVAYLMMQEMGLD